MGARRAAAAIACALAALSGCVSAPAASTDPRPLPGAPPAADPGPSGGLSPAERQEIDAAVAAYREAGLVEPRRGDLPAGAGATARPPSAIERVSWLDPGGPGDTPPAAPVSAEEASADAPAGSEAAPGGDAAAGAAPAGAAPPPPTVDFEAESEAEAEAESEPEPEPGPGTDAPDLVTIADVQLCRSVGGFGVYEPFASNTFTAGRPVQMVLYAEIEGFGTETAAVPGAAADADAVLHRVRLEQEVLLFRDADGLVVWSRPAEAIEDASRRRRRDFWSVQLLELPANLGVGRYRLKVRLTDRVSGSVDERSIPLRLVADASAE
ncbi:hypothetical protein [Phycisphaera mikurensis]|uniref:Uncharacterized protein n=1 Tax=Phycisphaera mikurensis (strain NBRC 102666 / KCTC 22515 / FYK2301M01) TaxID=1142394 RepID=I0IHR8_PHYMF|nr:hypothetical protein [Phycisphaera mikurensis]MBB6441050.1 hypothetical protein [Phycisphaera mikurensis]BAM04806.1 hypothetical protein PSMK_26470 [Phycisphaera mikurensis NBRC 102666]